MVKLVTIDQAKYLDRQDELQDYRHEFYIPKNRIYLDGNSLGLLSKRAEKSVVEMIDSWKNLGIDGWVDAEEPWFFLSERLGSMTAPLIGADPDEVIVTGSTTINLHQILATFFHPSSKRNKIIVDELNFPTDIYAVTSQLQSHRLDPEQHLIKVKSKDGHLLNEDDIVRVMTDEVAVIVLASVLYRSGQVLDMEYITKEAHKRGILVAFDLCHSIGSIEHSLSKWNVDFAFWCTYKHLNGGPGSVGGMYINRRHFGEKPGLAGWFGSDKDKQFDLEHDMTIANNSGAFQTGTPHLLSAAPLIGSLSIFKEVGMERIREKSLRLTQFMIELIDQELGSYHFIVRNPRQEKTRGGHVFLEHEEAARICKALKQNNVIPDFRAPNGIRLAPVALYNTFTEVWETVQILKQIMEEKQYNHFENKRDVIA
ncbi:kynureninase [Pseudogracilibacillus auburnensis]|uniref:kynureninase n=1 Tax=Pseudogracilibacillus auburnensis TaxID=1494959 RepID=UPI000D7730F0|nr:kynureninase [Pseudogracilibacillus auburnensis]